MPIKFKRTKWFKKADLEESCAELNNPCRGWYHIYTLNALPSKEKIPLENEIWFYDNAERERLALALIDISAFRTRAVSEEALLRIDDILNYFRRYNKHMLLRFVYDTRGECIMREPLALSVIKGHMEQIGNIVKKYCADILAMQGLFIGNWGEMHGSKFSDDESSAELADVLYKSTDGKCCIALRTPSQIRAVAYRKDTVTGLKERLALFNDGMFASPTDLGTYAVSDTARDYTAKQSRAREIEWQNTNLAFVPNGGEAAANENPVGFMRAAEEMRLAHISYLNSAFNSVQLEHWKNETFNGSNCWRGVSGYAYIGRHLGYRFVVRDVFVGEKKELFIEAENCGFANLCAEADCILTVERENGASESKLLDTDPRRWTGGQKTVISTGIFLNDKTNEKASLYLSLKLKQDGSPIFFANKGAEEKLKIGELTNTQRT